MMMNSLSLLDRYVNDIHDHDEDDIHEDDIHDLDEDDI